MQALSLVAQRNLPGKTPRRPLAWLSLADVAADCYSHRRRPPDLFNRRRQRPRLRQVPRVSRRDRVGCVLPMGPSSSRVFLYDGEQMKLDRFDELGIAD